jgi:hypothetical protein
MGCGGIIQILFGNPLFKKVEQKFVYCLKKVEQKFVYFNPLLKKVEQKCLFF